MIASVNLAMLLTDGFGGFGGISKFNKDLMQALNGCSRVSRLYAFPRLIEDVIDEPIPESVVYDRKAARGKFAFLRRVLVFAWSGRKPNVVICGHLNLLPAAWLLARIRGSRLALVIHGIEAWKCRNRLFRAMVRSVDSVIAVSRFTAERFRGWSKISDASIYILPNCVDLEAFAPKPKDIALSERYGIKHNKIILTMGRIASAERYKGFDEVIEVMPKLVGWFPTLKYMIVGDGDDRNRLELKARSLGISDKVIFTGRIPEQEKASHLSLADAYVMPSQGEGFGIVFLEALACGIPSIGSKTDGSREALLDGKLGRLVDPKAPEELIEAITKTLNDGIPGERNDGVGTFDVAHFRSRVASWLEGIAKVR